MAGYGGRQGSAEHEGSDIGSCNIMYLLGGTSVLQKVQKELVDIFGERVAFHEIERMLYSSDLGALPELARKQINTYPDAVVQPNSSDDLSALVNLAMKYRTPLISRGSGTAGYGGAVPIRGGIVVDFNRLNRVIEINEEKKTVTVEPGVVWKELEIELRSRSLALQLYPGSAISATVGGWIGNGGGVGIGYSIHAGVCLVADGTEEAEKRLVTVLTTDPGTAVVRHADAGYEAARRIAKEKGIKMPMLR